MVFKFKDGKCSENYGDRSLLSYYKYKKVYIDILTISVIYIINIQVIKKNVIIFIIFLKIYWLMTSKPESTEN